MSCLLSGLSYGQLSIDTININQLGYDPAQRAFYWYLMSISEEKRKEWISSTFTEQEKDNFLNKIDSLHMDIQLPDPSNSTIPDTLKK